MSMASSSSCSNPLLLLVQQQRPFFTISRKTPKTNFSLRFPPLLSLTSSISSSAATATAAAFREEFEQEEEEEKSIIGDCLVFEDGIFDDPFLLESPNSPPPPTNINKSKSPKNPKSPKIPPPPIEVEFENLIPDKWLQLQKDLNITKKERRKLSQQLEFGRKVENKRQGLVPIPIHVPIIDKVVINNDKLNQLKPLVLDNPPPPPLIVHEDDEDIVVKPGRVAARNPRLAAAVYGGGGLDDISQLFSSSTYQPRTSSSDGTRKLFSKEDKSLFNRRVPDLAPATSGKWHPLHTLAASGEFYLVNSLLKHNLDINAPDKDGLTAIHKAILGKKQAIFNFLLRESANPFVRDAEGATLLHYAVLSASNQMIKILLLYNVDLNIQDNDGWTALHLAVQSRRTDVVRLLLIKGADKTLKNRDGLTPLDLCLYSGRDTRTYELIRLIKRHS